MFLWYYTAHLRSALSIVSKLSLNAAQLGHPDVRYWLRVAFEAQGEFPGLRTIIRRNHDLKITTT